MHPNIPPPRQGTLRSIWRKITLMFWAFIVPDLILTWALKQWLAARAIEKKFKKDHNWTTSHAHFLGMGGFVLASTVQTKVLEMPEIPKLTLPVHPKKPQRVKDQQHDSETKERYWKAMEQYWEELNHQRDSRQQFWTDWERNQKNCADYIYSNSIDPRKLQVIDKEDFERLENFGFQLPDRIAYLYESPGTLTFYRFRHLVDKSIIAFPTITSAEIKDKAKGDLLSKTIAILQTTWFVVQCIARSVQGLAITELELVTLALASLNGGICYLWWDKPLGAEEPVALYLRGMAPVKRNEDEQRISVSVLDTLRTSPQQQRLSDESTTWRTTFFYPLQETLKKLEITDFPVLFFHWLIYLPIATVIKSLYAIINTSDVSPGASHVPMFYATNVSWSNSDNHFIYIGLPIISIIFGGLHCIAWNFAFPTAIEQILWRVSSLSITIIPLVTGLVWSLNREKRLDMKFLLYPALTLLVVYVLARLTLLVQALSLLWREPQSAYLEVDWTQYLPHVS